MAVPGFKQLDFEETSEKPLYFSIRDEFLLVYRGRRRVMVGGKEPAGTSSGNRPVTAREWRRIRSRLEKEAAWERAERYSRMMAEGHHHSIRSLARALGEDHPRVTRVLSLLGLPAEVVAALRERSGDHRVRAYFTEKRLRAFTREGASVKEALRRIAEVGCEAGGWTH
ncbi:MAG: hypothetical protein HY608_10315 [Planctomycetes bacterium]|nr:hypothetical protein [Planctomycetota bacterium]